MEVRTKMEELELDHLIHQENELQYKKEFCHLAFSRYPDFQPIVRSVWLTRCKLVATSHPICVQDYYCLRSAKIRFDQIPILEPKDCMGTFVRSFGNNCQNRPRHISIFPTLTPPPHALCPTAGRGLPKRSTCIKGRATGKDPSTPHSPLQICWFFFFVHTSSFLLSSFTCPSQYQIISKWHPRQQSTRTRPPIQAPQSQQTPTVAPEQQPTSQA